MLNYWLIVSLSWIGFAKLQHISSAYEDQLGPAAHSALDTLDPVLNYALPNSNYFNSPFSHQSLESERETAILDALFPKTMQKRSVRVSRSPEVPEAEVTSSRFNNFADGDGPPFIPNDARISSLPLIVQSEKIKEYARSMDILRSKRIKKSFSPWGGKRDENSIWSWKRSSAMREPSMPKRVRFSPWGGKRSTQLIFKPGSKAAKIIFSKSFPELTRIISSYSPNGVDAGGLEMIPMLNKKSPIRILAMSKLTAKDALPFKAYFESTKMYKPGHPYSEVNLKRDDKRKVKFSAWGGKRAPPIIGPIWSPSTQTVQDHTLDTIILIRKDENENDKTTKA